LGDLDHQPTPGRHIIYLARIDQARGAQVAYNSEACALDDSPRGHLLGYVHNDFRDAGGGYSVLADLLIAYK